MCKTHFWRLNICKLKFPLSLKKKKKEDAMKDQHRNRWLPSSWIMSSRDFNKLYLNDFLTTYVSIQCFFFFLEY